MAFYTEVRFEGSLSGHGTTVSLGFSAAIDEDGRLRLQLDPIDDISSAFAFIREQRTGESVDLLALEGTAANGHSFRSDAFHINSWSHGERFDIQGGCYDAELTLERKQKGRMGDARIWLVRQFRTFHRLARDTPFGRVVAGGPKEETDSQAPGGFIGVYRPEGDQREDWWEESERLLIHLGTILSFGCDTYLRPVLEERYQGDQVIVRVADQSRTQPRFMAPFYDLHMQPIFDCACRSFEDRSAEVRQLDPAIRWLTAPVFYDESRLINAMSALENILDHSGIEEIDLFEKPAAFRKTASKVRKCLAEIGAPEGMLRKVPELNRRSLAQKVLALLEARGIVSSDLPADWLKSVISLRNQIVHTGVTNEFNAQEPDTLDRTIWVREIVTRIILERIGFVGAYRSWLHHDTQLHFPECIPMDEWVRRNPPPA
jgi:hypothetical protein